MPVITLPFFWWFVLFGVLPLALQLRTPPTGSREHLRYLHTACVVVRRAMPRLIPHAIRLVLLAATWPHRPNSTVLLDSPLPFICRHFTDSTATVLTYDDLRLDLLPSILRHRRVRSLPNMP